MVLISNEAPQGNMLESWLASPAAKLKKHQSEMLGNVDVAGTGQLLLSCVCSVQWELTAWSFCRD
jgi:hypothetical protein